MKPKTLRLAIIGCFAPLALMSAPAFADLSTDLKAEIEAQRALLEAQQAQIAAQRTRLEALEKKLDAASAPQGAAAAPAPAQQAADAKSTGPKLLASADWEPGFTFQVTPADTVTLYG